MLFYKNTLHKEQFAKAYKFYVYVLAVLTIIFVVIAEIGLIVTMLSGNKSGKGSLALLVSMMILPLIGAISIMLNGHFSKVIQAYSESYDGFIKA